MFVLSSFMGGSLFWFSFSIMIYFVEYLILACNSPSYLIIFLFLSQNYMNAGIS